ncbi:MAG TPA: SURF1 family protein [Acidimicrobiales bacterium]|nr:SURF1 family protein [Acidimicrobiales bacterium]
MYEFTRRPKWIVGHLFALSMVALFITAGLWQLSRHYWRQGINEALRERSDLPAEDLPDLMAEVPPGGRPDDIEYRMATARGTYQVGQEILIRNRSFEGASGCHVLTPLALDSQPADSTMPWAVLVVRGWIPLTDCEQYPIESELPTTGTVEVTGLVRLTQTKGFLGATDPAEGVLSEMARVDIDRIRRQSSFNLYDVYLELATQIPPGDDLPAPVPPPERTNGPHLGYMVQWFLFAAVVVVGYPLILRHQAHKGAAETPVEPPSAPASVDPTDGEPETSRTESPVSTPPS